MTNVLWLQGGACSGNTMSFLNAEEPSAVDLVTDFGINVLWHPSLGLELGDAVTEMMRDCVSGKIPLDIFVKALDPGTKTLINREYHVEIIDDKFLTQAHYYGTQMLAKKQIRQLPDYKTFIDPTFVKAIAAS